MIGGAIKRSAATVCGVFLAIVVMGSFALLGARMSAHHSEQFRRELVCVTLDEHGKPSGPDRVVASGRVKFPRTGDGFRWRTEDGWVFWVSPPGDACRIRSQND